MPGLFRPRVAAMLHQIEYLFDPVMIAVWQRFRRKPGLFNVPAGKDAALSEICRLRSSQPSGENDGYYERLCCLIYLDQAFKADPLCESWDVGSFLMDESCWNWFLAHLDVVEGWFNLNLDQIGAEIKRVRYHGSRDELQEATVRELFYAVRLVESQLFPTTAVA